MGLGDFLFGSSADRRRYEEVLANQLKISGLGPMLPPQAAFSAQYGTGMVSMGLGAITGGNSRPESDLPKRKAKEGIRARRAWYVGKTEHGWRLKSTATNYIWETPVLTAHEKPSVREHCGIHAFYLTSTETSGFYEKLPVTGEVLLYGKVIRFAHGYRAEKAMIRNLSLKPEFADAEWLQRGHSYQPDQAEAVKKDLEQCYQCDVTIESGIDYNSILDEILEKEEGKTPLVRAPTTAETAISTLLHHHLKKED